MKTIPLLLALLLAAAPASAAIQVNQNQSVAIPACVAGTANASALAASFWVKVSTFPQGTCPQCPSGNNTSLVVTYGPGIDQVPQAQEEPRLRVSLLEANPTPIRKKNGQIIGWTPNTTKGNIVIQASSGYDVSQLSTTNEPLTLNTWYHVAAQVDWATLTAKIWVNGVLNTTGTFAIPVFPTTGTGVSHGSSLGFTSGAPFGEIADYAFEDVRVYARALTGGEVASINAGFGLDAVTDYVARHKANEATSGAVVSVTDYGPDACHAGPGLGAPVYVPGIIQ